MAVVQSALDFFGTGTVVVFCNHVGTTDWSSERLTMSVKTSASCSAVCTHLEMRAQPGMPSGPGALNRLILLKYLQTSALGITSGLGAFVHFQPASPHFSDVAALLVKTKENYFTYKKMELL